MSQPERPDDLHRIREILEADNFSTGVYAMPKRQCEEYRAAYDAGKSVSKIADESVWCETTIGDHVHPETCPRHGGDD